MRDIDEIEIELKPEQAAYIRGIEEAASVLKKSISDHKENADRKVSTLDKLIAEISASAIEDAVLRLEHHAYECRLRFADANRKNIDQKPESLIYSPGKSVYVMPNPESMFKKEPCACTLTGGFRLFFGQPYVEVTEKESLKTVWVPEDRIKDMLKEEEEISD